jgi:hypothetical protein
LESHVSELRDRDAKTEAKLTELRNIHAMDLDHVRNTTVSEAREIQDLENQLAGFKQLASSIRQQIELEKANTETALRLS